MKYKWRDIPGLISTPIGRLHIIHGLLLRSWPILYPCAVFHRKTTGKQPRVIAVVGSFGKTTTTRSISAALGLNVEKLPKRTGGRSLAQTVLRIRPNENYVAIEAGIDGMGQMSKYARMIRPDITVATSIGSEHNTSLGTLEVTRNEKAEMVRILPETGTAILNGDDPNVLWMASQTRARIRTFGFNKNNDIRASDISLDWPNGTRFELHTHEKTTNMQVRLIGRHMLYPILAAISVALNEGFSLDQIIPSLEELSPAKGRMEPVQISSGAIILRDDFKSALETIHAVLDTLAEIPAKRRLLVLGDVTEAPGSIGPIYKYIGKRIAEIASSVILITGSKKKLKAYKSGIRNIRDPVDFIAYGGKNILEAIDILRRELRAGDVVLVKGRSSQRFERIIFALEGRMVRCDLNECSSKAVYCNCCPMLEQGWEGIKVVV